MERLKQQYINSHRLGHLTIAQLKRKAVEEDVFVYGDKAQILQCFDQQEQMTKLIEQNN